MIARAPIPLRFAGFAVLLVAVGAFAAAGPPPPHPPAVAPSLLSGLVWRNLGPFRGGRVAAVSGTIGQPGVFYMGLPAGGVWKTTSAGETWTPIFDAITSTSSVGAVEVAPSDPNVIYVGMGDLISGGGINEGDGIYKSVDAGKTWRHLGLDSTKQIPSILVDPRDPNVVLIAAQGDVHKKSESRGVFRSTDGGKTWTKTLYVDDSTGAQKLAWASDHPEIVLATTVRHYVTSITGPVRVPAAGGGGGGGGGATKRVGAYAVFGDGSEVFVALEGAIDVQHECRRLSGELTRLEQQLAGLAAKLTNQQFVARAPAEVVAGEREKERAWRDQRQALADKLKSLGCS